MDFVYLPNEILFHFLQSCDSVTDALNLGATCHHLHSILSSPSNKLPTLFLAAESQYGPLDSAISVLTHNDSQTAHTAHPSPPNSFALLQQILSIGRAANKWATLYPSLKWRGADSDSRRLLTSAERRALRRAVYRSWLYSLAFHNAAHGRQTRRSPPLVRQRALLLHGWSNAELAELLDLQGILRTVLSSTITPSNGTVIRRHKARYPHDPFPLVSVTHPSRFAFPSQQQQQDQGIVPSWQRSGLYGSAPTQPDMLAPFASSEKYTRTQRELHGTTLEGWGDEITHYYVLEDMLKLHPGQLLALYDAVMEATAGGFHPGISAKGVVEGTVAGWEGMGAWFENNGETLGETVGFVLGERGEDGEEVRGMVEGGEVGIAV